MKAIQLMMTSEAYVSLRKALIYSGMSSCAYYYRKKQRRQLPLDSAVVEAVKRVALTRPSFGTRRMAAILTRELGIPVNLQDEKAFLKTGVHSQLA